MTITPLDFVAVVLASGAIIEGWNKGSIFATRRAKIQARQDVTDPETLKGRVLELLTCPFCQSYHVPIYLFLALLAAHWLGATMTAVVWAVVYGFAVTRVSNIVDNLLPAHLRYSASTIQGAAHGRTGSDPAPAPAGTGDTASPSAV